MNIAEQFINSIYNFRSYGTLSKIKGGKSFLYIFLLFLLMYMVFCINTAISADEAINFISGQLTDEVPDFRLKDSVFTFDAPMPYIIEDVGFTLVIDTTRTSNELMQQYEIANGFIITADDFVTINLGDVQNLKFSDLPGIEFDKKSVLGFISNLKVLLWVFLAIWIIFALAGKLIGVLVLTLVSLLAAAIYNQKLTFQRNWTVAIYASTVPVLFHCIHSLLGSPLGAFGFFVYWGLAIAYVFTGMYHISRENEQNQDLSLLQPQF